MKYFYTQHLLCKEIKINQIIEHVVKANLISHFESHFHNGFQKKEIFDGKMKLCKKEIYLKINKNVNRPRP